MCETRPSRTLNSSFFRVLAPPSILGISASRAARSGRPGSEAGGLRLQACAGITRLGATVRVRGGVGREGDTGLVTSEPEARSRAEVRGRREEQQAGGAGRAEEPPRAAGEGDLPRTSGPSFQQTFSGLDVFLGAAQPSDQAYSTLPGTKKTPVRTPHPLPPAVSKHLPTPRQRRRRPRRAAAAAGAGGRGP